jgi:hypothetical protein
VKIIVEMSATLTKSSKRKKQRRMSNPDKQGLKSMVDSSVGVNSDRVVESASDALEFDVVVEESSQNSQSHRHQQQNQDNHSQNQHKTRRSRLAKSTLAPSASMPNSPMALQSTTSTSTTTSSTSIDSLSSIASFEFTDEQEIHAFDSALRCTIFPLAASHTLADVGKFKHRLGAAFPFAAEQARQLAARAQEAPNDILPFLRERLLAVIAQRHPFYHPSLFEAPSMYAVWAKREVDAVLALARDLTFNAAPFRAKLVVKLIDGTGLRGTDLYVSATLDAEQKQRSPVKQSTAPWNHVFEFDVNTPNAVVTLLAKAHHRLARNAVVGVVKLALRDLERSCATRQAGTYALVPPDGADAAGDVAATTTAAAAAGDEGADCGSLSLTVEYRSEFSTFVELADADSPEDAAQLAPVADTSTRGGRMRNYNTLYRVLVTNLVDFEGSLALDDNMLWLLDEFATRFGIGALWRHLVNLEKASSKVRFTSATSLMAMSADVTAALRILSKKDALVTRAERAMFDAFNARIGPALDDAVLQHRKLFARNEPDGALFALLAMHRATAPDAASAALRVAQLIDADARVHYQQLRTVDECEEDNSDIKSVADDKDDDDANADDGDGDSDDGATGARAHDVSALPVGDNTQVLELLRVVKRFGAALSLRERYFGPVFASFLKHLPGEASDQEAAEEADGATSSSPSRKKRASSLTLSSRVARVMESLLWDDVRDCCNRADSYTPGYLVLQVELNKLYVGLERQFASESVRPPRRSLAAPFKPLLYSWLRATADSVAAVVKRANALDTGVATSDSKQYSSSVTDTFAAVNSAVAQLEMWQTDDAFHVIQFGDVAAETIAQFARLQLEHLKKAVADATPAPTPVAPAAAGAAPPVSVPPAGNITPAMCVVLVNLDTARARYQRLVSRLEEHCLGCVRASAVGDVAIMEAFDIAVQRTVDLVLSLQREARSLLIDRVSKCVQWHLARAIGTSPPAPEPEAPLLMYLDEQLDAMTGALTGKLFQATLRGIFSAAVASLTDAVLRTALTHEQVLGAVRVLRKMTEYFHGDGQGLPVATLTAQTQLLEQVLELYECPSRQLVDFHTNLTVMKRTALDNELTAAEQELGASSAGAGDRGVSLLEHREMVVADEASRKKKKTQKKKQRTEIDESVATENKDEEEDETAEEGLPTTRTRSITVGEEAEDAAAAAAAAAAAEKAEQLVERVAELRRKRAELDACADCVRRILAGRGSDDKTAVAFVASVSRGAGEETSTHKMARALFGLPDFELVLSDYSCGWGTKTGVLYLMSSSLCFHGSNAKFVAPLKSIARLERPRFTVLHVRVVLLTQEVYDLSLLRRQSVIEDIVKQANELGHQIANDL